MPFANKPRTPAQDIATLHRKVNRVRKPTIALAIARGCYRRATMARGCGQCLYQDWLTLTLAALDKAKLLIRIEHPFFKDTEKDLEP